MMGAALLTNDQFHRIVSNVGHSACIRQRTWTYKVFRSLMYYFHILWAVQSVLHREDQEEGTLWLRKLKVVTNT